jgi:N-acetylneuraminate synthase
MPKRVMAGDCWIGREQPVCIIAEIGINHNGDLDIAKRLIDAASVAGCDAVKFQKRTPELCVPPEQRDLRRDTPWGIMTYMEYRERVEFGRKEYAEIDAYCRSKRILWFASCWDEPAVDFIEQFDPACHKVPSACLTDGELLRRLDETGRPVILSTGMSTLDEMDSAVRSLTEERLLVAHATSTYPCQPAELNLRLIPELWRRYDCPIGYSGHEVGLQTTCAAVALGACFVERHITLDRAMWGSDQAASIEPHGLIRLVRDIRVIESALGDAVKRVYPSEMPAMQRLRRVKHVQATA